VDVLPIELDCGYERPCSSTDDLDVNNIDQGVKLGGISTNRLSYHTSSGVIDLLGRLAIDDLESLSQQFAKVLIVTIDVVGERYSRRSGTFWRGGWRPRHAYRVVW
jgi:hypothetical protein